MRAYGQVDGRGIWSLVPIIVLFFTTMFSVEGTRADGAPRRVLILHSYNYTFPANAAISDSLRLELARSSQPLEIEADFLDLARRPDEAHALRTAKFLQEKYANTRFDAVVVIGIPGMPFLLKYRDLIAPGVPVVWSDVTRATFDAMKLPANVTAVINNYKPERTIELANCNAPSFLLLFATCEHVRGLVHQQRCSRAFPDLAGRLPEPSAPSAMTSRGGTSSPRRFRSSSRSRQSCALSRRHR